MNDIRYSSHSYSIQWLLVPSVDLVFSGGIMTKLAGLIVLISSSSMIIKVRYYSILFISTIIVFPSKTTLLFSNITIFVDLLFFPSLLLVLFSQYVLYYVGSGCNSWLGFPSCIIIADRNGQRRIVFTSGKTNKQYNDFLAIHTSIYSIYLSIYP